MAENAEGSKVDGSAERSREKVIVRASITGILANVLLAAFKAAVGVITNSIAIVLDAVNNLSDAASSVITIIGTKLAGREPDKKHPFGYGRIEYLSALVISVIVLYAGVTSLIESVKKIIKPEEADYSTVSLIIVGVAVFVKIILGLYVKKTGEKVSSDSLINSGKDALLDSVISTSTLIAALVFMFTGLSLEAWLGAVISAVIVRSGAEMLKETVSKILGEPGDVQLLQDIKATVRSFDMVKGAFDLVLHNYGPDNYNGSIHIEIEDTHTMEELDELSRDITIEVYKKHGVLLTAIGIYSVNTKDPDVAKLRDKMSRQALSHEHIKQMHGFYYNKKQKAVRFDLVVSFEAASRIDLFREVMAELCETYPELEINASMDMDYGELL